MSKRVIFWSAGAILIILSSTQTFGEALKTTLITPHGRTAEDLAKTIRPFLAPEGKVEALDGKLIIKTTPENQKEINELINQIDVRPKQFLIELRKKATSTDEKEKAQVAPAKIMEANLDAKNNTEHSVLLTEGSSGNIKLDTNLFIVSVKRQGELMRLKIDIRGNTMNTSSNVLAHAGVWTFIGGTSGITDEKQATLLTRGKSKHVDAADFEMRVSEKVSEKETK